MPANIVRYSGKSAADTAQTVSTVPGVKLRVKHVTVSYSAAPTQTGVIITLNSGIAASYDDVLSTGTANVRYTYWTPDNDLWLQADDQLDVLCPSAGGVVTSSATIVCEVT